MEKVSFDVAEREVSAWLDSKGVSSRKRELHEDSIDTLVDAVVDAKLTLDSSSMEFTQILDNPLQGDEGENTVTQLKFKSRIKVATVQTQLQSVKKPDALSTINCYVAALTGKPKAVIQQLDTSDHRIAASIAVFFM